MLLLKDYDCIILYHPDKANVVADALSQKSIGSLTHVTIGRIPLVKDIHGLGDMGVYLEVNDTNAILAHFWVGPMILDGIKEVQDKDEWVTKALNGT